MFLLQPVALLLEGSAMRKPIQASKRSSWRLFLNSNGKPERTDIRGNNVAKAQIVKLYGKDSAKIKYLVYDFVMRNVLTLSELSELVENIKKDLEERRLNEKRA